MIYDYSNNNINRPIGAINVASRFWSGLINRATTHGSSASELPSEVYNDSNGSSDSDTGFADYNLGEYLEGLFSSVGAENETNRLYNAEQARIARDFQASEAQKERDWQTMMSNTAYSRAVQDLSSAGLNPVLAVSGMSQASSGMGASASGATASYNATGGDSISDILSSLANVASSIADFLPNITKIIKGK